MDDDDLRDAYERLTSAATPPGDAQDRVGARITQRRRRRTSGFSALALVVVVGAGAGALSMTGGDGQDRGVAMDPTTSPSSLTPGSHATCPEGAEPQMPMYDHSGYRSFTELVKAEAEIRGAYTVDRATERLLFLRDDGSVHTELFWMGEAQPGAGRRSDWFPSSAAICADDRDWVGAPRDVIEPAQPLTLDVGHCWIEPVAFDGEQWDVMEEDQFGWGGEQPPDFIGTGEAWRAGDIVTFVDESGHWLTLVPAGDPWALDRGFCD